MAKWFEKDDEEFTPRDRKRDRNGVRQQRREQRLAARDNRNQLLDVRVDDEGERE